MASQAGALVCTRHNPDNRPLKAKCYARAVEKDDDDRLIESDVPSAMDISRL